MSLRRLVACGSIVRFVGKMKFNLSLVALLFSCLWATAFGQQAKVEGYVVDNNENRIPSVRIVVTPGGLSGTTDNKGHFVISLPDNIQSGQVARITVQKTGWVIFNPMFGYCETQSAARNYQPLQVVIVRKRSLLALSPKRIGEVVAEWASERKNYAESNKHLRDEVSGLNRELDEYAFLRKYANEYGFTLARFITAVNEWAQIKNTDDENDKALKNFWHKNFKLAAQQALKASEEAEPLLDRANQQQKEASRRIILANLIAAGSFYEEGGFEDALAAFLKIEGYFEAGRLDKEAFAKERAKSKLFAGNVKIALANRSEGVEKKRLLLEAAATFDQVTPSLSSEESQSDLGFLQERLGDTMFELGQLTEGKESIESLNRALVAYSGLETISRLGSQEGLALTLSKRSTVLGELGRKTTGYEALTYLSKAAATCDEPLNIFAHGRSWENWATVKANLGNIMEALGLLTEGQDSITYLNRAVVAFDEALTVFNQRQWPQQWSRTQYNLGNTLLDLGDRTNREASVMYFKGAANAYRSALVVRTLQNSPKEWLNTQHDLALAYLRLSDLSSAAEAFASIFQAFPNNKEAYYKATAIYHQSLFNFEKSFALNQRWLARHKEDIGAQFVFVESHFTTARFTECLELINTLLAEPGLPAPVKIPLRAIEIASLLAVNEAKQVPGELDVLIADVVSQPQEYRVGWSCEGTRYFIDHSRILLTRRVWLGTLLDVLASENRDELLKKLKEVKVAFRE